jgi:DNA-binding beta-propeller fold protein YncE
MKVISKVPFFGIPEKFCPNPSANQIFTSENLTGLISIVDFDARTKTSIVEIEQPRDIIFSPEENRLYSIFENGGFFIRGTGKKICVIDLDSSQIIKIIGKEEGFGGFARNTKTKKIYVTLPHQKQIWVIDESSLEVERRIEVPGKFEKIIVIEDSDEVILGHYSFFGGLKIISFNLRTYQSRKIFSRSSDSVEGFEMKYYAQINKLYVHRSEVVNDMGDSRGTISIIDFDNPKSKYDLDSSLMCPYFEPSTSNENTFFIQNHAPKRKGNKPQLIQKNIVTRQEKSYDISFAKVFSESFLDSFSRFLIHPYTGNLIIVEFSLDQIQLYETSFGFVFIENNFKNYAKTI